MDHVSHGDLFFSPGICFYGQLSWQTPNDIEYRLQEDTEGCSEF